MHALAAVHRVGGPRVAVGRQVAVPVRHPDVVRGVEAGLAGVGDDVGDAGGRAGVDAGVVARGVQGLGPRRQVRHDRGGVGGRAVVALHVEVEGVAGCEARRLGERDRVGAFGGALRRRGGLGAAHAGAAAVVDRRLVAHVDRHDAPAHGRRAADPRRRDGAGRAAEVAATEVDAGRAVGRLEPGRHGGEARRTAGVEREPDAVAGAQGGGGGRGRCQPERGGRRGSRRGGGRGDGCDRAAGWRDPRGAARVEGRPHRGRVVAVGRGDDDAGVGHDDLGATTGGVEEVGRRRRAGGHRHRAADEAGPGRGVVGLDEERLGDAGEPRRALLRVAGVTEVDGVDVEADAPGGVRRQIDDRPARRHGDAVAAVRDGGGGRRPGGGGAWR